MGGVFYAISGVATAGVAFVGGLLTYYLRFRAQIQALERDKVAVERERAEMKRADAKEFWDAFDKRIGILKERLAGAKDDEREATQSRLYDAQDECESTLKAWQQKQELAALVPREAITADAPKLSPEEVDKLRALLAGSTGLPAILLTSDDYFVRGNAYWEAREYKKALEAYGRALELKPNYPAALTNRGAILGIMGRYQDAATDLSLALELDPCDRHALNNRGHVLTRMKRYDDALKDYNLALELEPDLHLAFYNRATAHSLAGRFEEALPDLEAAINRDEKYREMARTDDDFKKLRKDQQYGPRFRQIVGKEDNPEG
ncbi:MAG: tetratricopeptide repeat protein [Dehalococcoidia bacterium]